MNHLYFRHNYTTPKSFLEQIALYRHLVKTTNGDLTGKMDRLENGLNKLKNTAEQVVIPMYSFMGIGGLVIWSMPSGTG